MPGSGWRALRARKVEKVEQVVQVEQVVGEDGACRVSIPDSIGRERENYATLV